MCYIAGLPKGRGAHPEARYTLAIMRIIIHIDMDAFFAAVEERYNPQFRGKPLVVGADPKGGRGRGVVSTSNYAARRYGIRSAMPIIEAWRRAEEARRRGEPATIFLTGNSELYTEVSERIMEILKEEARQNFAGQNLGGFEQASIDEAYLEWTMINGSMIPPAPTRLRAARGQGLRRADNDQHIAWLDAEKRAREMKKKILNEEGLTCSAGVGPNKLIAKMASEFKKPDGLTVVRPEDVAMFLAPLPIRALPGIGPKAETVLHARGVRTIGDIQNMARDELVRIFGAWGTVLSEHSRGNSHEPVSGERESKSIGEQETFAEDTLEPGFILERARALAAYVFERFAREGFRTFRTVAVTVRFADFKTHTRSHTSRAARGTRTALDGEVLRLLLPFLDARENPSRKKIRLIGVRVEKLSR